MDKNSKSILDRYVVNKNKSAQENYLRKKMDRNLQPEVVKIQSVKDSLDKMKYINPSEAKRLLFEIEALKESIEYWVYQ